MNAKELSDKNEESMKTLKEFKNEQMADREFAEKYQAFQPKLDVIKDINEAEISPNLAQKQLGKEIYSKVK